MNRGYRALPIHLAPIVHSYCNIGDIDGALSAIKQGTEQLGIRASPIPYAIVINALRKRGDMQVVQRWADQMAAAGIKMDNRLHHAIADSWAQKGKVEAVRSLLARAGRTPTRVSGGRTALTHLIQASILYKAQTKQAHLKPAADPRSKESDLQRALVPNQASEQSRGDRALLQQLRRNRFYLKRQIRRGTFTHQYNTHMALFMLEKNMETVAQSVAKEDSGYAAIEAFAKAESVRRERKGRKRRRRQESAAST